VQQQYHDKVLPARLPHLTVGTTCPDIQATDLNGDQMNLVDHRGKVVLLVFWASWCGPCMGDVAHEKELVERFQGRPFELIGVNGDESLDKANAAVAEYAIPWKSFWNGGSDGRITSHWGVRAWPTLYVIDDLGVIRNKSLRGRLLDAPLEQLIAEAELRALSEHDGEHTRKQ
jgi:thiol-disulfide isomerase/thioredoxin